MNKSPEDAIRDAQTDIYKAHYNWSGPEEAEAALMNAMAELAYAEAMWRSWSHTNIEESQR